MLKWIGGFITVLAGIAVAAASETAKSERRADQTRRFLRTVRHNLQYAPFQKPGIDGYCRTVVEVGAELKVVG